MLAQICQINEPVNRAQQMILRDMIINRELAEKRALRFLPRTHYRQDLPN